MYFVTKAQYYDCMKQVVPRRYNKVFFVINSIFSNLNKFMILFIVNFLNAT
jgi:hypothetical protein